MCRGAGEERIGDAWEKRGVLAEPLWSVQIVEVR